MASMNSVHLLGHAGGDSEEIGTGGMKLSLATSDGKDADGNPVTNWHKVNAWGKTAEYCGPVSKGDLVIVEGSIGYRKYEEKWYTTITAWKMSNLSRKKEQPKPDNDPPF